MGRRIPCLIGLRGRCNQEIGAEGFVINLNIEIRNTSSFCGTVSVAADEIAVVVM
jgi:hypothetical protein